MISIQPQCTVCQWSTAQWSFRFETHFAAHLPQTAQSTASDLALEWNIYIHPCILLYVCEIQSWVLVFYFSSWPLIWLFSLMMYCTVWSMMVILAISILCIGGILHCGSQWDHQRTNTHTHTVSIRYTVQPNLHDPLSCDKQKKSTRGKGGGGERGCHYIGWGVSFDLKEIGSALMDSFSGSSPASKEGKTKDGEW